MTRAFSLAWLFKLLMLWFSFMVLSIPAQAMGKRVALVLGNGAYTHSAPLANPANDAAAVGDALRDLGFEVIQYADLDTNTMRTALREYAAALQGADVSLFFYAGHGIQVDGQNYLAGVDARLRQETDLLFEALRLDDVLRVMENSTKTRLLFLDACRDNPLSQRLLSVTRSYADSRGLARVNAGSGTLIAYATAPGQVALDGSGDNSPFTSALLSHIGTPGLDVALMLRRVRNDVSRTTDGQQVPWNSESLTGAFYFSGPDPAVPTPDTEDAELIFWQSIAQSQNCADYQAYLSTYPAGRFSLLANARRDQFCGQAQARLLAQRLDACDAHFRAQRLTTGDGGNAYDCYRELLVEFPDSDSARAGIARIESQYRRWIQNAIEREDPDRAARFVERLAAIDTGADTLQAIEADIDALRQQIAQAEQDAEDAERLAEQQQAATAQLAEQEADAAEAEALGEQQTANATATLVRDGTTEDPETVLREPAPDLTPDAAENDSAAGPENSTFDENEVQQLVAEYGFAAAEARRILEFREKVKQQKEREKTAEAAREKEFLAMVEKQPWRIFDGVWVGIMKCGKTKDGSWGPFQRSVTVKIEDRRALMTGDSRLGDGRQYGKLSIRGDPKDQFAKVRITGAQNSDDGHVIDFRYVGDFGDTMELKGNRGSRRCTVELNKTQSGTA